MPHFRTFSIMVCILALPGIASPPAAQYDTTAEIMRVKLGHTQGALEAVVLEDYAGIEKHALRLELLAESSNWNVFQTPEYTEHSTRFRRAAQELGRAGRERDLDDATAAYGGLTRQCVECHKYVRGARRASAARAASR